VAGESAQELLSQLCADLRLLWSQAGGPSLRELEVRLDVSKSQLGAILNGQVRRLPDWAVVSGLVTTIHTYAVDRGRLDRLSLRTGLDEYWRPRYAVLDHAFSQPVDGTAPTRTRRPAAPPRPRSALPAVPAQLPPAVAGFTGRATELARLDRLLADQRDAPAAAVSVPILAISGTAGIGKTTLAVQWAHRAAARFPDGQLYVNLRGFDPSGPAVDPAVALSGFLDALGVPPQRVPNDVAARTALYRSALAGKQVLVLLDNARDAEHVRPLIPATPGCCAIVTSRNQLAGAAAAHGAHLLVLDLLSSDDAWDLLARRMGADRLATEPNAVREIIESCCGLPLALAVVAARASIHPSFSLQTLADRMRDIRGKLYALDGGDVATNVRAVFSASYQQLEPPAARMFRLLGLLPGPDTSVSAAASLAGLPLADVRPLLDQLTDERLIAEHVPGRYTFHDLLRAYAGEMALADEADEEREAALRRVMDHYVHSAHAAAVLLDSGRQQFPLDPARAGTVPETFTETAPAMAWFAAEHAVLLSAVDWSVRAGWNDHTWRIAAAIVDFLDRQGHWHDWVATGVAAVAATQPMTEARARAHRYLGAGYTKLDRFDDAHTELRLALDIHRARGDQAGQVAIHHTIAAVLERQGRYAEALDHVHHVLDGYRADRDRAGEARAINGIGWFHALLGDYPMAVTMCRKALALSEELDDQTGQAFTWDSLGYAHHGLADYPGAATCYRHAIELYRQLGNRPGEAESLDRLGETHQADGDDDAARAAWQRAVDLLDDIDPPAAVDVRAKLATLTPAHG
jgi:tetratricopeptide (TPR) repeat protein